MLHNDSSGNTMPDFFPALQIKRTAHNCKPSLTRIQKTSSPRFAKANIISGDLKKASRTAAHIIHSTLKSHDLLLTLRRNPPFGASKSSVGPPARTGRGANFPMEIIRSYITKAPATPTVTQNFIGILIT